VSRVRMVLWRIAGSVVGLLVGGGPAVGLVLVLFHRDIFGSGEWAAYLAFVLGAPGVLVAGAIGAAAAATIAQKFLRQRSSFWRALLVAILGTIVAPGIGTVVGAVIGSGWGAESADAA